MPQKRFRLIEQRRCSSLDAAGVLEDVGRDQIAQRMGAER